MTDRGSSALVQTRPIARLLPETPSEEDLRLLYPHGPGVVRLGMIAGARGEATGGDGSSRSLSGPADLRVLRVLRSAADVVVVGAATALGERYGPIAIRDEIAATRSPDQAPTPVVAIVGSSGAIPPGLGPGNALYLTTQNAPAAGLSEEWGESLLLVGRQAVSPHFLVDSLLDRGLPRILCEGGPSLARLLLDADLVDDYCLTRSPHDGDSSGPRTPEVPTGWESVHTLTGSGMVFDRWIPPGRLTNPWTSPSDSASGTS